MGNISETLRILVLKTNPYWPFSKLNRVPYHLALRGLIRLCRRFPQIQSVYLRHGLLQSDWIPAISDIDLTVLFQRQQTFAEFQFLKEFWTEMAGLKRRFPMIGEIDLLDADQTGNWTRFTIRGFEAKHWKLLSGENRLTLSYSEDPQSIRMDSLNYALLYYFNFFLRRLPIPHSIVRLAELQRIASKILRYSSFGEEPTSIPPYSPKELLFEYVLNSLDVRIESFLASQNAQGPVCEIRPASKPDKQTMESWKQRGVGLKSVYLLVPRNLIVVNENLKFGMMSILNGAKNDVPLLLTQQLFHFLVRFLEPRLYARLANYRTLAFGEDLLEQIPAPSMDAYRRQILDQIPTILAFPSSREFIQGKADADAVESLFHRALFVKLIREHNQYPITHDLLLKQCKQNYGSYFERFETVLNSPRELYEFLREVTREICAAF